MWTNKCCLSFSKMWAGMECLCLLSPVTLMLFIAQLVIQIKHQTNFLQPHIYSDNESIDHASIFLLSTQERREKQTSQKWSMRYQRTIWSQGNQKLMEVETQWFKSVLFMRIQEKWALSWKSVRLMGNYQTRVKHIARYYIL